MQTVPPQATSILDVACGIARYHRIWLNCGYKVTGVDLSDTFIQAAKSNNPACAYYMQDVQALDLPQHYDIVTALQPGAYNALMARGIFRHLNSGGVFLLETRNPNHPRQRFYREDQRTWTHEEGIFKLRRHEYDPVRQGYITEQVDIDPTQDEIVIRDYSDGAGVGDGGPMPIRWFQEILTAAGFQRFALFSRECEPMELNDESIYKIWLAAYKED